MHNVYILKEIDGNRTYVGYTVNLERRLRQHNGEITGGAKSTKGRKWEFMGYLSGFPNNIIALQCEWKLKHPYGRKKGQRLNRIDSLKYIFDQECLTSNSKILNKDLELQLFIKSEYLPITLPENIMIQSLDNNSENDCEQN